MIIENETMWNTDDLKALVMEAAKRTKVSAIVRDYTLFLFTTCRQSYGSKSSAVTADDIRSAEIARMQNEADNTIGVEIRSHDQMKGEVLDRLAMTANDVQQDMPAKGIERIALCIMGAISDIYGVSVNSEAAWARDMPLRIGKKITYGQVAVERRTAFLERRKESILSRAKLESEKIDRKIEKIRDKATR